MFFFFFFFSFFLFRIFYFYNSILLIVLFVCLFVCFFFFNLWDIPIYLLIYSFFFFSEGPEGKPCTMVVRTLHWTVPHYWVWGLPFFLFYSTRSSQFLHERPNQTFLKAILCSLFSPIMVTKLILQSNNSLIFLINVVMFGQYIY